MNKMNKKGFTLIEMLVVIAIIAVLVAIIIPVIGNSTIKASAAANAANLRSYASEMAILYLEPGDATVSVDGNKVITISAGAPTAPTSKKMGSTYAGGETAFAVLNNGQVTAVFAANKEGVATSTHTVDWFANIASTGKVS